MSTAAYIICFAVSATKVCCAFPQLILSVRPLPTVCMRIVCAFSTHAFLMFLQGGYNLLLDVNRPPYNVNHPPSL